MINCKKIVDPLMDALMVLGHGHLAVISVGSDLASQAYIRGKKKDCERLGFGFKHYHFDFFSSLSDVHKLIDALNKDSDVTGIILQLPTPWRREIEQELIECIAPEKDVDGFLPESVFQPCTPEGICYLLNHEMGTVAGKTVCVVGRGRLVGSPLRSALDAENATIISCNSYTQRNPRDQLYNLCYDSDAIVLATGQEQWFPADQFPDKTVIVDCGCFRGEDGKLHGEVKDVNLDQCCTPVPGGVGLFTRLALMVHVAGFESIESFVSVVKKSVFAPYLEE